MLSAIAVPVTNLAFEHVMIGCGGSVDAKTATKQRQRVNLPSGPGANIRIQAQK